jgi:hypothetical protein
LKELVGFASLDSAFMGKVVVLLNSGILHSDRHVVNSASRAVDSLASELVTKLVSTKSTDQQFVNISFHQQIDKWHILTATHLQTIVEDEESQWTLSRSMLPLMILCKDHFDTVVSHVMKYQHETRRMQFEKVRFSHMYNLMLMP